MTSRILRSDLRDEADTRTADLQHQLGLILAALAAVSGSETTPPEASRALAGSGPSEEQQRPPQRTLDELPRLISVAHAATVLGISRASAYRYAAAGDLPTVRLGGRTYIVTARLKAVLDAA